MCKFLLQKCGIWEWCIVGFVQQVYRLPIRARYWVFFQSKVWSNLYLCQCCARQFQPLLIFSKILTTDTPYGALMGEIWGVFCEFKSTFCCYHCSTLYVILWYIRPHYNGTWLYYHTYTQNTMRNPLLLDHVPREITLTSPEHSSPW